MKIRFLLLGTSLFLIPQTINAQCVASQDCATLGYTETSCSGGSGVKCPFGNKWACFQSKAEIEKEVCADLGFSKTCVGDEYSGGSGAACRGYYAACNCADGYGWQNGSCQLLNGAVGELYYCKGVVVGVKATGMGFYVVMKSGWDMDTPCEGVSAYSLGSSSLKILAANFSRVNALLEEYGGEMLASGRYYTGELSGVTTCGHMKKVVSLPGGSESRVCPETSLNVRLGFGG